MKEIVPGDEDDTKRISAGNLKKSKAPQGGTFPQRDPGKRCSWRSNFD